jgi:hypothetical protein
MPEDSTMSNERMITLRGTAIDILIGITCFALLGKIGMDVWKQNRPGPIPQQATNLNGRQFSELAAPVTERKPTLVLAVAPRCSWCTKSIPFYRDLIKAHQENPTFRIGAFFVHGGDLDSYLRDNGLAGIERLNVTPESIPIKGTPTILLADENGMVMKSWSGYLNDLQQKQVTYALAVLSGTGACSAKGQ